MTELITVSISAVSAFFGHHFAERFFTLSRRNIRLIFKGYQIHHSFFGAVAIAIALIFTGSIYLFILFGYGLGNIWQHKYTHNQVSEKGMVFISKLKI